MATVPIFSPNGELGDIPAEQLAAAVKAGAKPGVTMKSPNGELGVVPADRVQDAVRARATIVPLKDQETQHPGFWKMLGSDLEGMAKGVVPHSLKDAAAMVVPGVGQYQAGQRLGEEDQARKEEGRSVTYRIAAPIAEITTGVNARGMEESANQGDTAGVYGHAAAPVAAAAITAGAAEAAPIISDVARAGADRALTAVKTITPKQAMQVAGAGTGAVAGHGPWSTTSAYYGAKSFGHVAEAVLGKERANLPIFRKAATLDEAADSLAQVIANDRAAQANRTLPGEHSPEVIRPPRETAAPIPPRSTLALPPAPTGAELGEIPYTGKSAAESGEALATVGKKTAETPTAETSSAPRFNAQDRAAAKSLLEDALKQQSGDVVDRLIPHGTHYGVSLATKSRVEFYLERGDVANAEASLDAGAKQADPDYQPFYRDPKPVPSTNEIRARVQAEAKAPKLGTRADLMDDKAVDQEWQWQLERHGWSAASEARREFIARNSTGMTKGELARKFAAGRSGTGAEAAPAPTSAAPADDLTSILQKSVEQVRKKKAQ